MKIRNIHIAGYGRFLGQALEFSPGLQIIIGPNEKGKSTIRAFIADMLYGQKRNETQRDYDDSNALRAPWNGGPDYGGTLAYELDGGEQFRVERVFDRDRESIQIFDGDDQEVTDTFNRYRNRELDFARRHLGLSKDVFVSAATITHMSLTELGDSEALDQIRETVLALVDSGGGAGTAASALDALAARIAAIGRPDTKHRPLPAARAQLAALEKELESARAQQAALRDLAAARKALLDEGTALHRERAAAEAALEALARQDVQDRLRDVETLQEQLAELKVQCDQLGDVAEFPAELDGEVQAAHGNLLAATRSVEKTRAQHADLRRKLDSAQEGGSAAQVSNEFPQGLEQEMNESQASLHQLGQRIEETKVLVQAARDRMDEVQSQLAEMPDFSRLSADPVEWLSQLASSFAVALRAREEECALRTQLRKEVEMLRAQNAPYDALFEPCADFPELAREYQVQLRLHESQRSQHASDLHSLQGTFEEVRGELRAFLPLGVICILIAAGIGSLYFFFDNRETGYGAIVALGVGIIFLTMHVSQHGHLKRLSRNIGLAQQELDSLQGATHDPSLDRIDDMLRESGLQSVRELEALHDQYKSTQMELKIRASALAAQEEKATEAEERVPQLLERFRDTFARAGESVEKEGDVQEAAGRAIARYQEYREAKRRATSNRSVLERHEAELKRLELLAAQTRRELEELEAEAREFVRDYGLPGIDLHGPARELIAAFRAHLADNRELQGRHEILAENARNLERQLAEDESEFDLARKSIDQLLARAGVGGIDDWNHRVVAAREFHALAQECRALEKRIADKLGRNTLDELRARAARPASAMPETGLDADGLRDEIARLNDAIDRKAAEERTCYEELTEQSLRSRPIAEVEEEIAHLRATIDSLEGELEAASYAMALLETVAEDKHAELAPTLARTAGAYLNDITRGGYQELSIGRDLGISVRIPETDQLHDAPEKSLSKGTVDQIYLALRLAFVQSVSENNETVPMLLDDPFANYDDARLEAALALMQRLGARNQILLFTCREDVVTVAESLQTPIIRL